MKVSIIVPVYNVEKYIQRCFDSVSAQTYKDIECIFVDDSTPDNCNELLKAMIQSYKGSIKFSIINHKENKGLSEARNSGTRASIGDYVYYLDSDDEITPNCISDLVGMVSKYPGVDIVQGNTRTIPEPENDWRNISTKNFPVYTDDHLWLKTRFLSKSRIPVNAWNKLINRSFIISNNLFFKAGIIHEDEHWIFYVAKHVKSMCFIEYITYLHYVVPGSIMQAGCFERSIESNIVIFNDLIDSIDNELPSIQRKFCFHVIKRCFDLVGNLNEEKDFQEAMIELTKNQAKTSFRSFRIFESLAYFLQAIPAGFNEGFVVRKISGLLIRFFPW
jgi:glycosyltransferase involved in cell wall biosynthesis